MMKRRGSLFAMITALGLAGFACGRAGSNSQVPETQSKGTKSAGTIADESTGTLSLGAKSANGTTNGSDSVPFDLSLRDWSGQVGEFTKADGKDLHTYQLPDGTVFMGEVTRGIPDGHGVITQPNGTRQEGEWRQRQAVPDIRDMGWSRRHRRGRNLGLRRDSQRREDYLEGRAGVRG